MVQRKKPGKKGPKPERVKIEGDWKDAISEAMKKKRPKDGWPESDKKKGKSDK